MEELKITKDRILAAASKCATAKATLEVLFPEAFEDDLYSMLTGNELSPIIEYLEASIPARIYDKVPGRDVENKARWIHKIIIEKVNSIGK